MEKLCASASGCAQESMILCAAMMVSLMAVCASWNPWPVPLGGKSEWPAEDPVTNVGSAVLDPCAR